MSSFREKSLYFIACFALVLASCGDDFLTSSPHHANLNGNWDIVSTRAGQPMAILTA